MKIINNFLEYKIIDMSMGEKVESWNNNILRRPDPQIIWSEKNVPSIWDKYDAKYQRSSSGGGSWEIKNHDLINTFTINYKDLIFNLKLMSFKHTGLFPEQAYNWDYVREIIKNSKKKVNVLNLFAYTGAISVACLKEGAAVTHVDSSRGMVEWAKENIKLNNLDEQQIRYIVDDVIKFVKREINRGAKYDIIIMDPPSFGRGSKKEVWSIEEDLDNLIRLCVQLLSEDPLLFLINSYTTGLSKIVLENILNIHLGSKYKGTISSDELGIKMENSQLILPCGIYARWENSIFNKNSM